MPFKAERNPLKTVGKEGGFQPRGATRRVGASLRPGLQPREGAMDSAGAEGQHHQTPTAEAAWHWHTCNDRGNAH